MDGESANRRSAGPQAAPLMLRRSFTRPGRAETGRGADAAPWRGGGASSFTPARPGPFQPQPNADLFQGVFSKLPLVEMLLYV